MYHSWTNSRVKRCTLFFKSAPEKTYNSRKWIVPGVQKKKKQKTKKKSKVWIYLSIQRKRVFRGQYAPKKEISFFSFPDGIQNWEWQGWGHGKISCFLKNNSI